MAKLISQTKLGFESSVISQWCLIKSQQFTGSILLLNVRYIVADVYIIYDMHGYKKLGLKGNCWSSRAAQTDGNETVLPTKIKPQMIYKIWHITACHCVLYLTKTTLKHVKCPLIDVRIMMHNATFGENQPPLISANTSYYRAQWWWPEDLVKPNVQWLKIGWQWLMLRDNDLRHGSKSTTEWLKQEWIKVLQWPGQKGLHNDFKLLLLIQHFGLIFINNDSVICQALLFIWGWVCLTLRPTENQINVLKS